MVVLQRTTRLLKVLVLGFLTSLLFGTQTVQAQYTPDGQAFILVSPISITSPSNSTYSSQSLTLNFTVKSFLNASKANITFVYSIDGKDNKTIDTQSTPVPMGIQSYYLITGLTTLLEMPEGSHSITVYGRYEFPISDNNIGLDDETVCFTISTNSEQGIPEFNSWIILPLFLIATLFGIIIRKKLKNTISV